MQVGLEFHIEYHYLKFVETAKNYKREREREKKKGDKNKRIREKVK